MKNKPMYIFVILIILLVNLACGIQFNFPAQEIKTGPLKTQAIDVDIPDETPIKLALDFGAGELTLSGDAEYGMLVSGEALFNVPDLAPRIDVDDGEVKIATGDLQINGIPRFPDNIRNEWNLHLSSTPMSLKISAGAYKGYLELGGLALTALDISDGASDVNVGFSTPNKVRMEQFSYQTGASTVDLSGLSNANFEKMEFKGGAGSYKLDFSGNLKADATVRIESGVSKITVIVPEGISAVVTFSGEITDINLDGLWKKDGSRYILEGDGPTLEIIVKMAAGSLNLKN